MQLIFYIQPFVIYSDTISFDQVYKYNCVIGYLNEK